MITDPISDMLTRIRNASMVKKAYVDVPLSKIKFAIAKILEAEKYVVKVETIEKLKRPEIRIHLKYDGQKAPGITYLKRISTPGRRIYTKADEIRRVQSGLGMAIISTPNGLMSSKEARKRSLGGEVICEIF